MGLAILLVFQIIASSQTPLSFASPSVSLNPSSGPPGTSGTFSFTEFSTAYIIQLKLDDGTIIGTYNWSSSPLSGGPQFTIPQNVSPRQYTVTAYGNCGIFQPSCTASTTFTVTEKKSTCEYKCSDYQYTEGQCNQGWQCQNGCVTHNSCN